MNPSALWQLDSISLSATATSRWA